MSTSMLYTMGMALDRAFENGYEVSLLVDGSWVAGKVAANDGVGVVLEGLDGEHCVVRTERVAAVKVRAESPYRSSIGASRSPFAASGSRPMPGPQTAPHPSYS